MICGAVSAVASCRRLWTDRRTGDPGVEACQAHHCVLVTASPGAPLKPSVHIFRACLHFSGSARSSCGPQLASVAPLSWALPPSRNPFVFPRSSLFAHVVTTNPTLSPPPNTTPHTTSQLRATACALHQFIVHRQHANQVPSQVPRTAKHSHAQPQPQPVPTANGHSHSHTK